MSRRKVVPLLAEPDVTAPNRLFGVRNRKTGELAGVADVHYFTDKMSAKHRRNALNSTDDTCPWQVHRGPDHWRGES